MALTPWIVRQILQDSLANTTSEFMFKSVHAPKYHAHWDSRSQMHPLSVRAENG